MASLNTIGADFVEGVNFALQSPTHNEETIKTSNVASSLAIVYEAARNAVEFRSEHLIRQAAIVRILRRRLLLGQSSEKLALLLVKELIWARYLKDDSVALGKTNEIEKIIDKYKQALKQAENGNFSEWLLGLAGCEIEESLVFNPYPQLLINFAAQSLQGRINIVGEDSQKQKDIQVYIAIERAFAKNSEIFITYHLLKAMFPEWLKISAGDVGRLYGTLIRTKDEIDKAFKYPLAMDIKREITRLSPPFNVIREMVTSDPEFFARTIQDKNAFDKAVRETLDVLYIENRGKLMRASTRSIIYIFLTKMVFGLALELPFDLFVGKTNYTALTINLLFPPTLMFLFNLGVKIPDGANTERIVDKIDEYVYGDKSPRMIEIGRKQRRISVFEQIFLVVYTLLFVGVFAFVIWGLNMLHFNPVSQGIFLFFLCVVSFFAFKVRSIARDYVYEEEKQGFFASLIDFLFLPIIRVGQWISVQITYLNVLGFIFDFIIEAPLKAFLEVIEEWVRFVRIKKEEIFTQA